MRRIFWGFCRNWFLIDPFHYLSSRSDFGFEFTEIFVIEKRLPELATLRLGESLTLRLAESESRRVGESAFECLKENSASRRVADLGSRYLPDSESHRLPESGVAMVSWGVAIRICKNFSALLTAKPAL
jgi:hypothetical protein